MRHISSGIILAVLVGAACTNAGERLTVPAQRIGGIQVLVYFDRDGTRSGYDLELVRAVAESVSIAVIASGGVGELDHLADGLLAGADAVLAASIFHYGQHTIGEAKQFLTARGLPIRPR